MLADCMVFDAEIARLADKVARYAFLKEAEDQANSAAVRMKGRAIHLATRTNEAAAHPRPEILAIPQGKLKKMLKSPLLKQWTLAIERIARYKPHTLDDGREKLLAMQGQMSDAARQVFRQLNDTDLRWGQVKNERGEMVELSHSTYSTLLHSPDRGVRQEAFTRYYEQYDAHRNSLAAAYNGSVETDAYYARVRNYRSSARGIAVSGQCAGEGV